MRKRIAFISIVFLFAFGWTVAAQDVSSRQDATASLKQQLMDVKLKETQLRMCLEELDEALKPENIERALAWIGSTRPEELREHRRKLLTIERNGLQEQLDLLEESRSRIESAIAAAETAAYLKCAQPSETPTTKKPPKEN